MMENITQLIPQREPVLMVDELLRAVGDEAQTTFTVRADNYFLGEYGWMEEVGVLEHIAQSASALAGHKAIEAGATEPPVGYIGEVKNFHCHRRPQVGDTLTTTIWLGAEVDGVTLLSAETRIGEELIAETQMKIFVRADNRNLLRDKPVFVAGQK